MPRTPIDELVGLRAESYAFRTIDERRQENDGAQETRDEGNRCWR